MFAATVAIGNTFIAGRSAPPYFALAKIWCTAFAAKTRRMGGRCRKRKSGGGCSCECSCTLFVCVAYCLAHNAVTCISWFARAFDVEHGSSAAAAAAASVLYTAAAAAATSISLSSVVVKIVGSVNTLACARSVDDGTIGVLRAC